DQRAAFAANQMVVLRVAVIVLVDFAVVTASDFAQQPRQDHVVKSPVDGGAADTCAVGPVRQPADELVGIEVLVRGKNFVDDRFAFARQAHATGGQVFTKFIRRTGGHRNRRKL